MKCFTHWVLQAVHMLKRPSRGIGEQRLSSSNHLQALAALKGSPGVHARNVGFLKEYWASREGEPNVQQRASLLAAGSLRGVQMYPKSYKRSLTNFVIGATARNRRGSVSSAGPSAIRTIPALLTMLSPYSRVRTCKLKWRPSKRSTGSIVRPSPK